MTPLKRSEARSLGLPRYFTGKSCPHGHIAERFTANATCVECAPKLKARCYTKDPQRRVQHNAKYYAANADAIRAANAEWRAANAQKLMEIRRRSYYNNKPAHLASGKLRKAHISRATPSWADLRAIRCVYEEAARLTRETGVAHDVDHIIPLRGKSVCGLHVHSNLRAIPAETNRRKGNSTEWTCVDCGAIHDRDRNAAANILRLGLETLTEGACHV